MKSEDLNWENMTREIELPPYEEWERLPLPEEIDEQYNQIMKGDNMRDDDIVERDIGNGWYELSTMVVSMGEEYRERRRYNHKPTNTDYRKFIETIEHNK